MNISKTTFNFGKKRGFWVELEDFDDLVTFTEIEEDGELACEWMFSYRMNEDGSFTWNGNVYLAKEIKEELPATIKDEKHLREVIAFVAKELKK